MGLIYNGVGYSVCWCHQLASEVYIGHQLAAEVITGIMGNGMLVRHGYNDTIIHYHLAFTLIHLSFVRLLSSMIEAPPRRMLMDHAHNRMVVVRIVIGASEVM